ncbi:hypothetical protein GCM10022382_31020 [Microbacterium invictum]
MRGCPQRVLTYQRARHSLVLCEGFDRLGAASHAAEGVDAMRNWVSAIARRVHPHARHTRRSTFRPVRDEVLRMRGSARVC